MPESSKSAERVGCIYGVRACLPKSGRSTQSSTKACEPRCSRNPNVVYPVKFTGRTTTRSSSCLQTSSCSFCSAFLHTAPGGEPLPFPTIETCNFSKPFSIAGNEFWPVFGERSHPCRLPACARARRPPSRINRGELIGRPPSARPTKQGWHASDSK